MFSPNQPTEICITPVYNGWLVRIPQQLSIADNPEFKSVIEGLKSLSSGGDPVLDSIKAKNPENVYGSATAESHEESKALQISRDESLFIFKTFPEVLAFLKVTVDE